MKLEICHEFERVEESKTRQGMFPIWPSETRSHSLEDKKRRWHFVMEGSSFQEEIIGHKHFFLSKCIHKSVE